MEKLLIETKRYQEGKEPPEHRKTLKWYKMLLMRTPGKPFDEMKVDFLTFHRILRKEFNQTVGLQSAKEASIGAKWFS